MASSKGSALFLILIAVALFAALSYAVTHSGRGGGTISRENAMLRAAQIMQGATAMKVAIQRAVLLGTPIDSMVANTPANDAYPGLGTLNGYADFCSSGLDCIFAPEGGGIPVPSVPPRDAYPPTKPAFMFWVTSYFEGVGSFNGMSIPGLSPGVANGGRLWAVQDIGTAAPEDLLQYDSLTQEVCAALNQGLNIPGIPVHPDPAVLTLSVTAGKEAACYDLQGAGYYVFYQVLYPR